MNIRSMRHRASMHLPCMRTPVRFGVTDGVAIDVTSTGVGKSLICRGVGETTPLPRAAAPAVVFEVDDGPNYCDPVLFLRFLMQSKEKI
jgi:hypothetical protein